MGTPNAPEPEPELRPVERIAKALHDNLLMTAQQTGAAVEMIGWFDLDVREQQARTRAMELLLRGGLVVPGQRWGGQRREDLRRNLQVDERPQQARTAGETAPGQAAALQAFKEQQRGQGSNER